jgi:hypothetical protein
MTNTVKLIGEIGVDAGLCWIGDPSYILHTGEPPQAIGKDWGEFCDRLRGAYPTCKQLHYDLGHPGLGVVVSTGYGDGVYPVYAEINEEGRIARIMVEFISDEEEE